MVAAGAELDILETLQISVVVLSLDTQAGVWLRHLQGRKMIGSCAALLWRDSAGTKVYRQANASMVPKETSPQ